MDQCTNDVRSARWKKILLDCQQRPTGITVKQWLKENQILEQSYYYWQCKFRKEAHDQMENSCLPSVQHNHNAVSFVEISAPIHQKVSTECSAKTIKPVAVIQTVAMSIAISNDISQKSLSKILQEVGHA